jgi:hypothetical protein
MQSYTRDVRKRKLISKIDYKRSCDYPFAFFDDYFKRPICPKRVPMESHQSYDVGNFPENIKTVFWCHEGENDEDGWSLLAQLENGLYIYFYAWCDYTGFDCQGGMELWASSSYENLIEYAISEYIYHEEYMKETKSN